MSSELGNRLASAVQSNWQARNYAYGTHTIVRLMSKTRVDYWVSQCLAPCGIQHLEDMDLVHLALPLFPWVIFHLNADT